MAGQVKFVVDAETGKAVAGFLKIVDAQKKVEQGFRGPKKHAEELETATGKIGEKAHEVGKEVLGMVTAFASVEGVKKLIENVTEELKHAREEVIKFHESAAGGESMPGYIKNLPAYKQRSLELSSKYGADVNQVVNPLREKVYVESSDQTEAQREEMVETSLKARHMAGADPMAFAGVMDNMMHAYKGLSVKQAANASMFLKEKGAMGVGEQQETLSSVLPTMSMLKVPFEQVEALMGMVPKAGGSNSQIGRGIKEALFKFDDLAEGGHITKGAGLMKNFQELADFEKSNPEEFRKALGKRAAPAVSFVAQNQAMFQSLLGQARGYGKGDRLEEIEKMKLADPETAAAMQAGQIEQLSKNADVSIPASGLQAGNAWELAKAGARYRLPTGFKWLAPAAAAAGFAGLPEYQVNQFEGAARLNQATGGAGGSGGGGEHAEKLGRAAEKLEQAADKFLQGHKDGKVNRNSRNNAG